MHLNYIRNKLPVILKRFTSLVNIRVFHYLKKRKRKKKTRRKKGWWQVSIPIQEIFP